MKANLAATAVLGLAVAALAVWTALLHARTTAPAPASSAAVPAPRDRDGEDRLARIEARLDELEAALRGARSTAPRPGPPADGAPAAGADLDALVDAALRRRADREREERFRRQGERFVMGLDPDVRLDDERRRALAPRISRWLDDRDRLFSNDDIDARSREAAVASLLVDLERDLSLRHDRAEVTGILRHLGMVAQGRGRPLEDLPGEAARRDVDRMPPPTPGDEDPRVPKSR